MSAHRHAGEAFRSRGGIDRATLLVAGVLGVFLAGCTSLREEPRASSRRGASAADRATPVVSERDRVLYDYRLGVSALRAGEFEEAKAKFDDAIARIGGIITNDAEAARARG